MTPIRLLTMLAMAPIACAACGGDPVPLDPSGLWLLDSKATFEAMSAEVRGTPGAPASPTAWEQVDLRLHLHPDGTWTMEGDAVFVPDLDSTNAHREWSIGEQGSGKLVGFVSSDPAADRPIPFTVNDQGRLVLLWSKSYEQPSTQVDMVFRRAD